MSSIISVQDIRTSLASIAKRAEQGESFTVVKNSKPAFRIEPIQQAEYRRQPEKKISVREMQERFKSSGASDMMTPEDLDQIIDEVHSEKNAGREKTGE